MNITAVKIQPNGWRVTTSDGVLYVPSDHRYAAEVQAWLAGAGHTAEPEVTLAEAMLAKIGELARAYNAANAADIDFTNAAGTTKTYQADARSIANLSDVLASYSPVGSVPSGFYWVASDNSQQPFTLTDLQGLAKALADRGWTNFKKLQSKKDAVRAAATVADAQAITW